MTAVRRCHVFSEGSRGELVLLHGLHAYHPPLKKELNQASGGKAGLNIVFWGCKLVVCQKSVLLRESAGLWSVRRYAAVGVCFGFDSS